MTASHSDAFVLFGLTDDLAHKMIFPALDAMANEGQVGRRRLQPQFAKSRLGQFQLRGDDSRST